MAIQADRTGRQTKWKNESFPDLNRENAQEQRAKGRG